MKMKEKEGRTICYRKQVFLTTAFLVIQYSGSKLYLFLNLKVPTNYKNVSHLTDLSFHNNFFHPFCSPRFFNVYVQGSLEHFVVSKWLIFDIFAVENIKST